MGQYAPVERTTTNRASGSFSFAALRFFLSFEMGIPSTSSGWVVLLSAVSISAAARTLRGKFVQPFNEAQRQHVMSEALRERFHLVTEELSQYLRLILGLARGGPGEAAEIKQGFLTHFHTLMETADQLDESCDQLYESCLACKAPGQALTVALGNFTSTEPEKQSLLQACTNFALALRSVGAIMENSKIFIMVKGRTIAAIVTEAKPMVEKLYSLFTSKQNLEGTEGEALNKAKEDLLQEFKRISILTKELGVLADRLAQPTVVRRKFIFLICLLNPIEVIKLKLISICGPN